MAPFMHVKLATLRVVLALGVQIYKFEVLEWTVIDKFEMSRSRLSESVNRLGESGCKPKSLLVMS